MAAVAQTSSSIPIQPLEEIEAAQAKFREGKKGIVYCGSSIENLYLLAGSVDHIQRITFVCRKKRIIEILYCAWRHFIREIESEGVLEFYEKNKNPMILVVNCTRFSLVFKYGEVSETIPPFDLIAVDREGLIKGCKAFVLKQKSIPRMRRTI